VKRFTRFGSGLLRSTTVARLPPFLTDQLSPFIRRFFGPFFDLPPRRGTFSGQVISATLSPPLVLFVLSSRFPPDPYTTLRGELCVPHLSLSSISFSTAWIMGKMLFAGEDLDYTLSWTRLWFPSSFLCVDARTKKCFSLLVFLFYVCYPVFPRHRFLVLFPAPLPRVEGFLPPACFMEGDWPFLVLKFLNFFVVCLQLRYDLPGFPPVPEP